MKRSWITYPIKLSLLLLVAVLTACVTEDEEDNGATAIVNVGDNVPDFTLYGSDGLEVISSSLKGQPYILNFFDTRCKDCQQLFPVLQRIYDKYQGKVPILNVPRSQSEEEVKAYWDQERLSLPYYTASDKDLYYQFATSIVPRTYVVDGSGKVCLAFTDSPIADYETLDKTLGRVVDEGAGSRGDVNLSFRIKVPALRNSIEEYYFHNEYTISRLEVYFFETETKKFFTKAVITDLTKDDSTYDTEYDIIYLFDNIRLRADKFDIFLIANYNYGPDVANDEEEFLNMVDSITYNNGVEANMPDKGPVMTNRATSLLAVDLIPWINKDYVLSVEMERVMAKLMIGVSQNTFQLKHNDKKYAEINITNYKFVNLNNQYYLFQHKDSIAEFSERTKFTMPDNYGDYTEKGDQYVVDPLFYKKTPNAVDASVFNRYYTSWFGAFSTEDFASMPPADSYGYAYVLENTSFKTSQKNGYSPGIVFKAAVTPVFVYLYDATQRKLVEEYRPEYWPKTIYLYKYNFYGSLQSVNIAGGLSLDELETYTDVQLKEYGIKQCKFNMGVYETYYTYWIQHRGSGDNPMGPMEYGIVRNNFYRMIVAGVSGIGNSSISSDVLRDNYPNSYADVLVDFTGQ